MMDQLQGNPILTLFFFLLFLGVTVLVERCGKKAKIRSVLKKIPWDKLWKVFVYWTVILFLRKLLYYKPIEGIVRTKDSLWWADTNITYFVYPALWLLVIPLVIVNKSKLKQSLKFFKDKQRREVSNLVKFGAILFVLIIFFIGRSYDHLSWEFILMLLSILVIPLVIVIKSKLKKTQKFFKDKPGSLVMNLVKVGGILVSIFFFVVIDHNSFLWEFILKSLLPLKVICSGKYLGLLTTVLLAYYIADGNKRLKKITIPIKKRKLKANVLIGSGLFLIFLLLSLVYFSGGWDKRFTAELHRAQTGKSVKKFEDLVDAVNSIKNEQEQANGLKEIAVTISKTGDWQWALDVTKTIKDIWIRFDALEQIFVITSRSENREEPEAVLQEMFDFVKPLDDIDKFRALKEIERLTFKTGNTTWVIKIIQKEVLAAVRIEDPKERVRALTKIAADIATMGYKNRVKEIFQQAIEQVNNIKYRRDQYRLLKEVAAAIAKTGDTQWAEVVVSGIVDEEIKNKVWQEIRKRIKKK